MSLAETSAVPWAPDGHDFTAAPAAAAECGLQLHPQGDERRPAVEDFIAGVYRQHFSARLTHFLPVLVSLGKSATGAAAGYRGADAPLYLEQYLPKPIERMLSDAVGRPVPRRCIVEVGQFASRTAGAGRRLMPELARHLVDAGFRWAVITATAELRRLLKYQRLSTLTLGAAQRHRIGDDASLWGSYYRHAPKVLAGDLLVSLARLERGRH